VTSVLVLALVLIGAQSSGTDDCRLVPEHLRSRLRTEWRGRYTNLEYLYSVAIPRGLTAYSEAEPGPQHGFGLPFGASPESYILVQGEANALERSADEVAADQLRYLAGESRTIESSTVTPVRMGSFNAVRLVAHYTCGAARERYVYDGIFALIPPRDLVFEIGLWAPDDRYQKDRALLEQMLQSWKYVPERRRQEQARADTGRRTPHPAMIR